jgi:hypothetical protein
VSGSSQLLVFANKDDATQMLVRLGYAALYRERFEKHSDQLNWDLFRVLHYCEQDILHRTATKEDLPHHFFSWITKYSGFGDEHGVGAVVQSGPRFDWHDDWHTPNTYSSRFYKLP